jgi:hypothetical protein
MYKHIAVAGTPRNMILHLQPSPSKISTQLSHKICTKEKGYKEYDKIYIYYYLYNPLFRLSPYNIIFIQNPKRWTQKDNHPLPSPSLYHFITLKSAKAINRSITLSRSASRQVKRLVRRTSMGKSSPMYNICWNRYLMRVMWSSCYTHRCSTCMWGWGTVWWAVRHFVLKSKATT